MRRRFKNSGIETATDDLLQQDSPLDYDEQLKVLLEFQKTQIREELRMRVAFVTFAAIPVAIVCFHFMVRQVLEPWGMKHHALFAGVVSSYLLALLEGASLAAPGLTALALVISLPALWGAWLRLRGGDVAYRLPDRYASTLSSRLLCSAVVLAGITCVPWLVLLRHAGSESQSDLGFAWKYIWLPVLPFLSSLGGLSVDWALKSTAAEVEALRRLTYDFKRV